MENSGIVMEILSDGKAVVLTKDGEFLSVVPHNMVDIGEETMFTLDKGKKAPYFSTHKIRWITSMVAVLLLLLIGIPGYFFGTADHVAAYVSVDINPSIDLGVDQKGKVIEFQGLNRDGQSIINSIGTKLKNLPIEQATALIVNEAHTKGFLKPDGDILISMTQIGRKAVPQQEWKTKIQESINKQKSEIKDVSMITLTTSAKIRENAEKSGLSTGKFAVYVIAQNKGYQVTIDQFKEHSVHDIMKDIPELKAVISQKITSEEIDQDYKDIQNKHGQQKGKQKPDEQQKIDDHNQKNVKPDEQKEKKKENKLEKQQEITQENLIENELNNKLNNQKQKTQSDNFKENNITDGNKRGVPQEEMERFFPNGENLNDQKNDEHKENSNEKSEQRSED